MGKLRTLWKKDPGLVVSSSVHVLALVLLVANFSHPAKFEDQVESVPVEMITTSELNQIMNGEKTAKQMPTPQRRVDQVAELEDKKPLPPIPESKKDTPPPPSPEKANNDPGDDEKPPQEANAPPPPPTPPARPQTAAAPPVPTPPERPVEKSEPQKADLDKPPPEDAEAIEPKPQPRPKVEPKKEPKKVAKLPPKKVPVPQPKPTEVKEAREVPDPPRKPEPQEKPDLKKRTLDQVAKLLDTLKPPKPVVKQRSGTEAKEAKHSDFSLDKITSMLDHDAPQRTASKGRKLTQLASLGSPTAHAEKLSPSMMAQIDGWLIDHYRGCWSYFGLGASTDYIPKVHVQMAPDGSLTAKPVLLNQPSDPNLRSLADSALRAVNKCNPMPIPEWFKAHYEAWRDRTVRFDPKEMS